MCMSRVYTLEEAIQEVANCSVKTTVGAWVVIMTKIEADLEPVDSINFITSTIGFTIMVDLSTR